MFPLTQAILIKNEFMTLIFVCVIFEQALQKRMCALHCRNYNYIIVKKKSRNTIDLYENLKCELNYFNYIFTRLYIRYYEKFSRIQQRIQKSINKQTEYDNLVLEQDILSKKK